MSSNRNIHRSIVKSVENEESSSNLNEDNIRLSMNSNGINGFNNEESTRQEQNHFNDKDLINIDHLPFESNSFGSKSLEHIHSDAAMAFELQEEEYAKYNISSSGDHSLSYKQDNDTPLYESEDSHHRIISDRMFAARLQQEENRKRYDQSTANDAIIAARLQQEENRKTKQYPRISHQANQSEVEPISSHIRPTMSNSNDYHPSNDFSRLSRLFASGSQNDRTSHSSRGYTNRIVENNQAYGESDRSKQRKALTNDEINMLPTEQFRRTTNKNDEENKCGVCWDEFQPNETLRRLTCLHLYHQHCIDPWLQKSNLCPICREPTIK